MAPKDPFKDSLKSHNGLLALAEKIDHFLNEFEVKADCQKEKLKFRDLCAKSRFSQGRVCDRNPILTLTQTMMEKFRSQELNLTYPLYSHPVSKEPILWPSILGNISINPAGDALEDATHLRLVYVLKNSSCLPIQAWENQAINALREAQFGDDRFQILAVNSKSLEIELSNNIESALWISYIPVVFLAAFIFINSIVTSSGRPLILPFIGLILTLIGTLAGWGLIMYSKMWPWQAINLASAFLLLGVGIDDTFVMLSAWKRHNPGAKDPEGLEEAMAETYKEAAVSITITSLTNIISFALGAWIPSFNTVKIFCLYTMVGLLFVFAGTLTALGPLIAITGLCKPKQFEERRGEGDDQQIE